MKRLDQTESPIFVILCVLCFQRQSFLTFISLLVKAISSKLSTLHFVLVCFVYLSSIVDLCFFYYVIKFVGISAVMLLVCLINVLDLHVVTIAKLFVIRI